MSSTQFECLLQDVEKPCEASDSINNITKETWDKLKPKYFQLEGL